MDTFEDGDAIMSYEGREEFLCTKGHYFVMDCNADDPTFCVRCKAPIAYTHSIDDTNGTDENDPSTMPALKQVIAHEDDWRIDHYGNKYALQIRLYCPLDGEWQPRNSK